MHSYKEADGSMMFDCAECRFGGNGDGSCGEGWAITRAGEQGCRRGRLMGVLEVEKFRQLKERNRQSTELFYRNGGMGHGTQAGS